MVSRLTASEQDDDRASELRAFDDTKSGVKGLVDSGITKVPRIFINPLNDSDVRTHDPAIVQLKFALVDLKNIHEDPARHKEVVDQVRDASAIWGFFQMINHGIPDQVMEEMLDEVRRFHEQDADEKRKWYTRDVKRRFNYNSNFDFYGAPATNWRDTFFCRMGPDPPLPDELPLVCRDVMHEDTNQVLRLGSTLFSILSEVLGLEPNHLEDMKCAEGLTLLATTIPHALSQS